MICYTTHLKANTDKSQAYVHDTNQTSQHFHNALGVWDITIWESQLSSNTM